jgi:peptidoglycan/LPS O-acetylase OafA/YrhL
MLLFAFFAFFWLERELWNFSQRPPHRILEWLGTWSYSYYLIHNVVTHAIRETVLSPIAAWCVMLPAIFASSYAFSRVIEVPSHQVGRRLADSL